MRTTAVQARQTSGLATVVLFASACTGTVTPYGGVDGSVGGHAPSDGMQASDARPAVDTAIGAPDSSFEVDASANAPLELNLIFRQTVQSCSGCGIWFDWQGVQSQKPRLVVEYKHLGQTHTAEYQHGLGGMDNAHSFFLGPENNGAKHSILVKQSPHRSGLFRADMSNIPEAATIVSATLHLHIETDEGLANSDNSSVLDVHACERPWHWDQVTWTHYASGEAWSQPGGDFGAFVRQIRAGEDLHDRGFSKANPNAHFDFTGHVQALQAER